MSAQPIDELTVIEEVVNSAPVLTPELAESIVGLLQAD